MTVISMHKFALVGCIGVILGACQPESPYSPNPNLRAKMSPSAIEANTSWAQCNLCHNNDSLSGTHSKHLFEHQSNQLGDAITCLDCHFNSVQYRIVQNGDETHYLPVLQAGTAINGLKYSDTISPQDLTTLIWNYTNLGAFPSAKNKQHFPAQKVRAANAGGVHNDGVLDLAFAPGIVDEQALKDHRSANPWSTTDFTCEAMRCHSGYKYAYRVDDNGNKTDSALYQWKRPITVERDD